MNLVKYLVNILSTVFIFKYYTNIMKIVIGIYLFYYELSL